MARGLKARLSVDERRAQLLALGLSLFGERPFDEIGIDDIASAAGVSRGLLYHYFGSKRGYYVACIEDAAAQLLERTNTPATLDGAARVREGLDAYFQFVADHRAAYRMLIGSGVGSDPEVAAVVNATRRRSVERMLEGMGIDSDRHPVFRAAIRGWIGQVEATCMEWLERDQPPRAVIVELLLGSLTGILMTARHLDPDAPPIP